MCTSGYVFDVFAKNESNWTDGLGGVREQTNRGPYAINNIDAF